MGLYVGGLFTRISMKNWIKPIEIIKIVTILKFDLIFCLYSPPRKTCNPNSRRAGQQILGDHNNHHSGSVVFMHHHSCNLCNCMREETNCPFPSISNSPAPVPPKTKTFASNAVSLIF